MTRLSSSLVITIIALIIAYLYSTSSSIILGPTRAFLTQTTNLIHNIFPLRSTPIIPVKNTHHTFHSSTTANMSTTTPRTILRTLPAREQSEGAGAVVRRSIGTPSLKHLTPFLMLDHFRIPPGAGFPDHPHRGQETITYLLQGGVDHEDFAGNSGTIGPGDLQFMTAGRGIMHAEMPVQTEDINVGLQLWVDLPEKLKGCEPRYRDLRANEIPIAKTKDGKVEIKVISGVSEGVESLKDLAYTPVWLLDITVHPGGEITQAIPDNWNAFAYTLSGAVTVPSPATSTTEHEQTITPYHLILLSQTGSHVTFTVPAGSSEPARLILIAGQPLDQNIVQYGPFVTTSKEAVYQAMMDFQTSTNGFERGANWESEIGKSMGRVR